ncbi:MAG: acyl-homoserine-lactone synthase [Microvirga sp.]
MVQVHVVTRDTRHRHRTALRSYHQWRHLIYVEERGWSDLRRPDGLDIDQFDDDHAAHLIAVKDGQVVGGSRMIPMVHPTLLSEVFPHLVERGAVPRDPQAIDWTRMFVIPSHRTGRGPNSVAGALFCAVMEYCLSVGATRVGGVMETFWLPRWQRFGWTTRPLGLPVEIAGSMTLAAFMDVDARALAGVRAATGWTRSVLAGPDGADDAAWREAAGPATHDYRLAG